MELNATPRPRRPRICSLRRAWRFAPHVKIFFVYCPAASLIGVGYLILGVAVALNLFRCLAVSAWPAARGHGVACRGALNAILMPGLSPKEKGWRRNENNKGYHQLCGSRGYRGKRTHTSKFRSCRSNRTGPASSRLSLSILVL